MSRPRVCLHRWNRLPGKKKLRHVEYRQGVSNLPAAPKIDFLVPAFCVKCEKAKHVEASELSDEPTTEDAKEAEVNAAYAEHEKAKGASV